MSAEIEEIEEIVQIDEPVYEEEYEEEYKEV